MSYNNYAKNGTNGTNGAENYTNGHQCNCQKSKNNEVKEYILPSINNDNSCFSYLGENYSFEKIEEIKTFLFQRTKIRPKIAIICGSGLGHLAETLTNADSFSYEDIPHFPVSTVPGHAGRMVFGYLNGIEVMCMQGRFHYYEGYALNKCSMPIRVMKICGCTHLIATNAAGGLNSSYKVGDIMIVNDHINLMGFAGNSPLYGPNDLRFGPRFPPMERAYEPQYIEIAHKIAKEMNMENETKNGIYTCVGGPNYETVAEMKMLKLFGVDAVGMSTVHEVITARHCNMKVFAFSLITNMCYTENNNNGAVNHEEVVTIGLKQQEKIAKFVTRIVEEINFIIKMNY